MSVCRACARPSVEDGLCLYHVDALKNLRSGFARWRDAYGELRFEDYLARLIARPETGEWVREVAELELGTREETR